MELAAPRRRPARPVGEAPIEALAADAERLAKGWLLAVIELLPLAEAAGAVGGGWASGAPRVCSGAVRALGSDEALARLGPAGELAGSLDELRAVLWSALRSAWPTAEPDQVWALGERLAVVIEALRGTGNAAPAWPDAVEPAVASALATGEPLALLLAELVDAGRMVSIEPEFPEVMARFLAAVEGAAGAGRVMVGDGEGRAWVIAAGADRGRAEALASRIAAAVREAPPWRGAPLVASVGVAVLGEDGEDVAGLIEAAEQAMLGVAARGGGA